MNHLPANPSRAFMLANPHLYGNLPSPQIPDTEPTQQAPALDGHDAGKAPGARCPVVIITLCRVNLLDVDAKHGSCKDLIDGLRYAGLIRGDKEGEIHLEVRQEKVAHFTEEETSIRIYYPMTYLKSSEIKCVADESSATEFIIISKDKTEFRVLAYNQRDAELTVAEYLKLDATCVQPAHPSLFE